MLLYLTLCNLHVIIIYLFIFTELVIICTLCSTLDTLWHNVLYQVYATYGLKTTLLLWFFDYPVKHDLVKSLFKAWKCFSPCLIWSWHSFKPDLVTNENWLRLFRNKNLAFLGRINSLMAKGCRPLCYTNKNRLNCINSWASCQWFAVSRLIWTIPGHKSFICKHYMTNILKIYISEY